MVSTIYIERALINPSGADPGLETVVLGTWRPRRRRSANWRLLDKNGRVTPIDATLGPGRRSSSRSTARACSSGTTAAT